MLTDTLFEAVGKSGGNCNSDKIEAVAKGKNVRWAARIRTNQIETELV